MTSSSDPTGHTSIVFLAGALRSGTTMFRLMLNAHPRISCLSEFDFLFDLLGPEGGLAAAKRLDASAVQAWLETKYIDENFELPVSLGGLEWIGQVVERARGSKPIVALPIHRNFLSAFECFPDAKFIHIVRDPRDCARSAVGMGWSGNPYCGAVFWLDAERSWDRATSRIPAAQTMEVKYEVLVRSPEVELTRVCKFLGVSYADSMLDFTGTTYERPDPAYSEQWKSKLSFAEIRQVESRVGRLLWDRGYEPTIPVPVHLGRRERYYLALQNRWARNAFAIRRIGLKLWLGEQISRRLGLKSINVHCRHRIHQVNRLHWK